MSDITPADGIETLRERIERRPRAVPPPRRPSTEPPARVVDSESEGESADGTADGPPSAARPVVRPAGGASQAEQRIAKGPERPATHPGETTANLAVRIRRSVDERLADLIHEFRRDDVRTSRAEIVEMLLWELPPHPDDDLRRRLADFRSAAPREAPIIGEARR